VLLPEVWVDGLSSKEEKGSRFSLSSDIGLKVILLISLVPLSRLSSGRFGENGVVFWTELIPRGEWREDFLGE